MDPTACLDRILAAYAHDDIVDFRDVAADLQSWHDKGGFLPAHLQSFADDMRFDLDRFPVATGRRDDDESDDDATLDFRVYIRPDATLDLQTGDASYDTDHRGDIGAGSVSPHDDDDDIRREVYRAFAEAVESAVQSFDIQGTFGVARQPSGRVVPRVVDGETWYDVHDDDGNYLATVATVAEARDYLN